MLEAGCGEGYGADLIASVARRVVAVDYDAATVAHVRTRYPRVEVMAANLVAVPMPDTSVDVVVNFQVIEHLWDQPQFITECLRVLRPGGALLMSTPNRITFTPGSETPVNPFHTRELNAAELAELLTAGGFALRSVSGVFHGPGLAELDSRHGGSIIDAQITRALADAPWPPDLLADVAADWGLSPDTKVVTATGDVPADWSPAPVLPAAVLAPAVHLAVNRDRADDAAGRVASLRRLQPEVLAGYWLDAAFWLQPVRGWIA